MNFKAFILILVFIINGCITNAQNTLPPKPQVGILLPLYLDSLFSSDNSYNYSTSLPKFAMPGLEFYSGVQLAIDSLQSEGIGAEIFVIDTKKSNSLSNTITKNILHPSLLIGVAQNVAELKQMATTAQEKNIPFFSATYPNDGGIANNPNMVILNSTLKSHCQAIYKYLTQNHNLDNIILVHKAGAQEDKIKGLLDEANQKSHINLKWTTIETTDNISNEKLLSLLDSTKNNVVICGTLNGIFGSDLVKQLSLVRTKYHATVLGMPTWDDIKFDKPEFAGVEIIYTTPFVTSSGNMKIFNSISNKFKAKMHSKASDMVFRGFEVTYRYIKNMLSHKDFIVDLSDRNGKIFSDFDLQPVKIKSGKAEPDYYENKKLYYVKKMDGVLKGIY